MITKLLPLNIALLLLGMGAYSQCDNRLTPSNNPTIAYKIRGNRCEGAYLARIGSPSLELASFTVGHLFYQLDRREKITINNPFTTPINIRSSALPLDTYYRMDAYIQRNEALSWEIEEVLYPLNIHAKHLGVYGWIGSEHDKTYLPVKPVSTSYNNADSNLYLIVRPSTDVREAKYRYAHAGANLGNYQDINASGSIRQFIIIMLPGNLRGTYILELAAKLESGEGWKMEQYKFVK